MVLEEIGEGLYATDNKTFRSIDVPTMIVDPYRPFNSMNLMEASSSVSFPAGSADAYLSELHSLIASSGAVMIFEERDRMDELAEYFEKAVQRTDGLYFVEIMPWTSSPVMGWDKAIEMLRALKGDITAAGGYLTGFKGNGAVDWDGLGGSLGLTVKKAKEGGLEVEVQRLATYDFSS